MDNPEEAKLAPGNDPPNMILMGKILLEGNYMAKYDAAMMSKTGKLGVVQPFAGPTLRRWANCFVFGARKAAQYLFGESIWWPSKLRQSSLRFL